MPFETRFFEIEEQIVEIGEGLLNQSLPKDKWTHEAHFASVVYFLRHRPSLDLETEMPGIISSYNVAAGGQNTESAGYHETLTQFYIQMIKSFLNSAADPNLSTLELCNRLVGSPFAVRNFPLKYYSKDLLFSPRARKEWTEPDLMDFDF